MPGKLRRNPRLRKGAEPDAARSSRAESPPAMTRQDSIEMPGSPLVTRCPQPHRAVLGSPATNRFNFEEGRSSANNEGREIFADGHDDMEPFGVLGKFQKAEVDPRPLSSVSTSAGPTPSPDAGGNSLPQSPILPYATPMSMVQVLPPDGHAVRRTSAIGQTTNKVFVGGIPQEMTQEELVLVLSQEIGPLKKAWLQRQRYNGDHRTGPTSKNHRGFGFGFFEDPMIVERWLGGEDSRFLQLPNWEGRKLEVKRAVSSEDMGPSRVTSRAAALSATQTTPPKVRDDEGNPNTSTTASQPFPIALEPQGAAAAATSQPAAALPSDVGSAQGPAGAAVMMAAMPYPMQIPAGMQLQQQPPLMNLARWAADAIQWPVGAVPCGGLASSSAGVQPNPLMMLAGNQASLPPHELEAVLRQAQPEMYED